MTTRPQQQPIIDTDGKPIAPVTRAAEHYLDARDAFQSASVACGTAKEQLIACMARHDLDEYSSSGLKVVVTEEKKVRVKRTED